MKICFIVNDASYFVLHWLDRAIALKASGHEVHLLCRQGEKEVMRQLLLAGVHWHEVCLSGPSLSVLNLLHSRLETGRLLRLLEPHLVHCITLKPCLLGAGLASHWPVVLSFPGLGRLWSGQFPFAGPVRKVIGWWWRRAAQQPRCLLTFEHAEDCNTLVTTCSIPSSRAHVTGCSGVDPDKFAYTPMPANDIPTVLFAARLIRAKGFDALVRICRRLRDEGEVFRLQVAGLPVPGDPDAIPDAELNQHHQQGDIEWLGACHDMPALIAQADIIALPSRYAEGIPRILLEAASCGRPSVAFDRGGCHTLLPADNSCGILVADGDEYAFGEALKLLIADKERCARKGAVGRQRVLEYFTAGHAAAQNMASYQKLLALSSFSSSERGGQK